MTARAVVLRERAKQDVRDTMRLYERARTGLGLDFASAVEAALLLAFTYEGLARVVAPYCRGFTKAGDEVLRGIQVRGSSRSGHFISGKLWTVSKMRLVRTLEEGYRADDPSYEPNDSAMARIHCRV